MLNPTSRRIPLETAGFGINAKRSTGRDTRRALRRVLAGRSRRSVIQALGAIVLAGALGTGDAAEAGKKAKRRRRRQERRREKLCQEVCGGSCKACRSQCTACSDAHVCYHLTDEPPICQIGMISACAPCSTEADCGDPEVCVTGVTFDGSTRRFPGCTSSGGVCAELLP
jgi:hypothetical protein